MKRNKFDSSLIYIKINIYINNKKKNRTKKSYMTIIFLYNKIDLYQKLKILIKKY